MTQSSSTSNSPGRETLPSPVPGPAVSGPMRWQSQQLLGGAREVQIEHRGVVYRLQVTSLGKLILTK